MLPMKGRAAAQLCTGKGKARNWLKWKVETPSTPTCPAQPLTSRLQAVARAGGSRCMLCPGISSVRRPGR